MSETHAERAIRKARTQRATNVYGVGATQLLRGIRHMKAELAEEGWEEIPCGATITAEGIYIQEEE